MKTALVTDAIVLDGITYLPGVTVTAEATALQPFVDLSLATWVADAPVGSTDSLAKPVLAKAENNVG